MYEDFDLLGPFQQYIIVLLYRLSVHSSFSMN